MIKKFFLGDEKNIAGKTFVWTILSGIVYALSSLIFLVVISQFLGDVQANIYSIGSMVAQQMLTIGKFSVRNYQVSDVKGQYTFADYFSFRTFTCFLMIMITIGWIFFGGYRGETAIVILGISTYRMAECMADVFEGLYQQRFRFEVSGRSQFFKNVIMISTFVILVIITRNLALAASVLAVEAIALVILVDVPLSRYFDKIGWRLNFKLIKGLSVACFSLFLSSFLYIYVNNSPKYAIQSISGADSVALGKFSELFMPVFAVDLFAGFTLRIWLTKMTMYHEEGDYKNFKKMIFEQLGIISGITVAAMTFMYFFGGFFLSIIYGTNLYGHEWTNALLMLAGGLVAVYNLFENVIIIYRHQHFSIVINILSGVAAFIIVPICTKAGGILGATIGYLIVNALRALGYYLTALYFMVSERKKKSSAEALEE